MPFYDYRCNDCGAQYDVMQRMADDPLTECRVCAGRIERVLHAPAIHFKGTGFHNTDYGTRRRPAGEDGGSGSSGGEGSGGGDNGNGATAPASGGDGAAKPASTESAPAKKTVGLDKV